MIENDLYLRKYQYERFIKNLNELLLKLNKSYINLVACKKTMDETLKIEDNYYDYKKFEKMIMDVGDSIDSIKNTLLPNARDEYNNILSQISKL